MSANPPSSATTGEFNYFVGESRTPMEDRVLTCPFDNPACLAANIENGAIAGRVCDVYNGRQDPALCSVEVDRKTFDARGLWFTPHVSQVENFWDEAEVLKILYPELSKLAKEISGADCTAAAAHALRKQGPLDGPRLSDTVDMARDAAFTVHNDFSDCLKDQFLAMYAAGVTSVVSDSVENGGLGIVDVEEFRRGRLVVLNFWRPLNHEPLLRNHLAVLDATSVGDDDVVLCRHPAKGENYSFLKYYRLPVPFINTLIRPNVTHKWYYFPGMTRDETMVFKNYDSHAPMPKNGVGMHSSFNDPQTPADAPPRESIETRVVCFWHAK
jgi:hypothetical protein